MATQPDNSKIAAVLNALIETCKNGQFGFETAAQGIKSLQTATLFNQYAAQRAAFADELQERVRSLGGKPEDSGTAAGAVHRGWIGVKSAATGGDEAALVAECERGENIAVKRYEEALREELPGPLRSVIAQQYTEVKAAHDRIRLLD